MSMTIEQAKSELMQIYGALSPDKQRAIDTLMKIEPCEDAISRQAVLDLIEHYNSDGLGALFYGYDEGLKFTKAVNKLPPVNPQEPKTGHWMHDGSHWKNRFICSECGYKLFDEPTNYCPNCGCAMVEPQESEDKE